jgi:fatty acid desaturase
MKNANAATPTLARPLMDRLRELASVAVVVIALGLVAMFAFWFTFDTAGPLLALAVIVASFVPVALFGWHERRTVNRIRALTR